MNENPIRSEIRRVNGWIAAAALLVMTLAISGNANAQSVVKKSTSGLCHCPGGQFYERTNNFEPFDNVNACLASGGREPQSGQGDCSLAAASDPSGNDADSGNPAPEPATDSGSSASDPVKQSESGLCHCPGGQFYDRTTNFTPFDTIGACLASGGREPQQGQGTCPTEPPPSITSLELQDYDRSAFGGWADADGDCQNTRHERLEARSLSRVITSTAGCNIVTGYWEDFYTGDIVAISRELDIDHIVPLRWAWERGASHWEREKRRQFANDPANLLPVNASANRSKGAAGPLEWLPPDEGFACEYVLRFTRVTNLYELEIPAEEAARLAQLTSEQCD